ncbi:MAG: winged helix-turn-helix transcriptional regulator [Lachnospiraceae bacterium]|nr:winged helix-turn-helix transcriptional regulator [Lachnospiraceae bacterium]MDE7200573.1 winged helix-turn-helix transcriptional regulator [Lachnospiraceae bacterium]
MLHTAAVVLVPSSSCPAPDRAVCVFYKVQRFRELIRRLDGITQSTLTKQLRELESDGFLHCVIYKEILTKVEYSLIEFGESFILVLQTMMTWSETNLCPDYQNSYKD